MGNMVVRQTFFAFLPVPAVKMKFEQSSCKFSQNFRGGLTGLRDNHNIEKNKMSNFVRL